MKHQSTFLTVAAALLVASQADAHVSLAGPAFANTTFEASFTVGHGCNGVDTYSVTIDIPVGVTSVRAINGNLGNGFVTKDGAGNVTAVTWTKNVADVLPADTNFYRLPVRMKLPNTPFARLYFPAHQVCRDSVGATSTVDWIGTVDQTTALPDGAPPPEPAPTIVLLPARVPGWNKFTVGQTLTDLSLFNDAEIVWAGDAAYSVNPNYVSLIASEATPLTQIGSGTEIWVKY